MLNQSSLVLVALCATLFGLSGCPGRGDGPRGMQIAANSRELAARPAIEALRDGKFSEAETLARGVIASDGKNAQARLVAALSSYVTLIDRQFFALLALARGRFFDHQQLRSTLEQLEKPLADIAADLTVASESPEVSLELCLACWRVDWNHDDRIDERDQRLFEIETDAAGNAIPDGDPRRRPTFRFDIGDVYWARAMIAFQQAAVQLLLGYQLADFGADIEVPLRRLFNDNGKITIRLASKARIAKARELVLFAIAQTERAKNEYQAETDDDREWVPNPRQKNHPLPLPVDDALYETWSGVLDDIHKLVAGEEGFAARELLELIGMNAPIKPSGFFNVRTLIFSPQDLVISMPALQDMQLRPDAALRQMIGPGYVENLPPSRLGTRLLRMRQDVQRGDETLGRKLRYVFWLN